MSTWNDVKKIDSADQNVAKYVFSSENVVAESVLYKYPTYKNRTVICCSTQSGCPMGCRFCGAGDYFVRSLTPEEIVSQPMRLLDDVLKTEGTNANDIERLQIMFMSMGEPMLNQKNLISACEILHKEYPNAALLISTSAPKVDFEPLMMAASKIPTIGLQFSIHESTDEERDQLIPFKNKLTLKEISEQGERFFGVTGGRTPFFNYCVHEKNNSNSNADDILELFDPNVWQATISVICEREESVAAANQRQRELADNFRLLLSQRGYRTRTFDPAGQDDIGGGCGQLWFVQEWMRNNPDKARPSIGCGKPVVHTPTELVVL